MKKLFFMLLILFAIYLGIQIGFNYFSKGNKDYYEIDNNDLLFQIDEVSNFKEKSHNYSYNIKVDNTEFNFQVFHNFGKKLQVIEDIKYFKNDNYRCILPIFKDKLILTDIMCLDNSNTLIYYYNLKGKDSNLDTFVSGLEEYKKEQFVDNKESEEIEKINIYKQNLIDNHYIAINNYKGIYNISKKFNSVVYNISLFKNDIYNQKLSLLTDKYYLVADYNQEYEFNEINLVDLVELDTYTITSDKAISFDSYIQGVIGNMVYLYDKDNKIQYEINIDKKSIVQYSSSEIKYYKDGIWTSMTVAEANNETKFTNYAIDYENSEYFKIDKVGTEVGYYYLYKKNGSNYDVYRLNIQNKDGLTYLFSTKNIDVSYVDNYVYFVNGNKVQVYGDSIGVKILVEYDELEFNKNIKLNVYSE